MAISDTFDNARMLEGTVRMSEVDKDRARRVVVARMSAFGWTVDDIAEMFEMLGIALEPQEITMPFIEIQTSRYGQAASPRENGDG